MSINSVKGIEAMCGCFTGLSLISVTLRFVARKKNKQPLKADDWLMLVALILFLGNLTTIYLFARTGFDGYNSNKGGNQTFSFTQQLVAAYKLIIVWTLGAVKASVLFFYKRVFCQNRGMNRAFRVIVILTLVINACWVVAFFFLGLFQCGTHFSYGTNHFKTCTLLNQYQLGFYISDIALDVWIMVVPVPYIIRLNMSWAKRVLTMLVFLLSFVGLGASIARLVNFLQTPRRHPELVSNPGDVGVRTSSSFTSYIWFGTLEMGAAIIAVNLPILYGLFSRHVPELLLRATRSWTSITSRVFSTSDKASVRHRSGSQASGEYREHVKSESPYNGTQTSAGSEIGRPSSTDGTRADEVTVHETVQRSTEKTHEQV